MATGNLTITVEAKLRGMRRLQLAKLALRFVRPVPLAVWLTCRLISGGVGADIRVNGERWKDATRVRAEVWPNGDEQ